METHYGSQIHVSLLGTLSCQNLTRIMQEIAEMFQHLFKCYEIHMHNHPVNSIQYQSIHEIHVKTIDYPISSQYKICYSNVTKFKSDLILCKCLCADHSL